LATMIQYFTARWPYYWWGS